MNWFKFVSPPMLELLLHCLLASFAKLMSWLKIICPLYEICLFFVLCVSLSLSEVFSTYSLHLQLHHDLSRHVFLSFIVLDIPVIVFQVKMVFFSVMDFFSLLFLWFSFLLSYLHPLIFLVLSFWESYLKKVKLLVFSCVSCIGSYVLTFLLDFSSF